jgi:hypothetical protein
MAKQSRNERSGRTQCPKEFFDRINRINRKSLLLFRTKKPLGSRPLPLVARGAEITESNKTQVATDSRRNAQDVEESRYSRNQVNSLSHIRKRKLA